MVALWHHPRYIQKNVKSQSESVQRKMSLSIKSRAVGDLDCRCNVPTFAAASESVPAVVDGELPHSLV